MDVEDLHVNRSVTAEAVSLDRLPDLHSTGRVFSRLMAHHSPKQCPSLASTLDAQ